MEEKEKTKGQLIDELMKLRRQITELEKSEIRHQQIEKASTDNEEKYRILVELAADGILIETVEGRILECNTAGAKIYGYAKEEMIGLTIADLVPEEFSKKLPKVITDKGTSNGIFVPRISKKKDGTIFPTEIATKIVRIGGKPRLIAYVRDITKPKEAEKKLRKARKMFASLFNSSPIAALYHDEDGRILNINPYFTKTFGYTLKEIIGRNIDEGMIYPENKIDEGERLTKKGLTFTGISEYETVRKKKDGTLIYVVISASPVIIDGQSKGTIVLYRDITERKKVEEALQKSQQEFASLFMNSPEALVYVDEKSIILNINPRFTKLFGYTLEEIKGKNINEGFIYPPNKIKEGKKLDKIASSKGYFHYETIRKKKDGTLFPVSISGSNIKISGQIKGLTATYIDITERKRLEKRLEKLAHFDVLTGCYARGYGLSLFERQMKSAQRHKTSILLLYLDLDGLKYINDTFGHKEGDKVLKEAAKFFKSILREIDIICRMGGDEFLLIFPDSSLNDVPLIKERITNKLKELNKNLNNPYKISFSIGISCYNPSNPLSIEELIRIADENMYEEKKKKKRKEAIK
jgi:diguanylate cyclase (GGDEF)-like protein/PAS domain S-box-containing protein